MIKMRITCLIYVIYYILILFSVKNNSFIIEFASLKLAMLKNGCKILKKKPSTPAVGLRCGIFLRKVRTR